jgi:hypothetical protein
VRVSCGEQVCEGERGQAGVLTEQGSDGVADERAQLARGKMPDVTRPGALGVMAVSQLAQDGLKPPSGLDKPVWPPLGLSGGTARGANNASPSAARLARRVGLQ